MITFGGSAVILAAAVAAVLLNIGLGDEVFAARIVSGLIGCL
jgi:hypothetical protein